MVLYKYVYVMLCYEFNHCDAHHRQYFNIMEMYVLIIAASRLRLVRNSFLGIVRMYTDLYNYMYCGLFLFISCEVIYGVPSGL